jgi:hypothetical protein
VIIISSFVRLGVLVVLLAHAIAQTDSIPKGQVVERIEAPTTPRRITRRSGSGRAVLGEIASGVCLVALFASIHMKSTSFCSIGARRVNGPVVCGKMRASEYSKQERR